MFRTTILTSKAPNKLGKEMARVSSWYSSRAQYEHLAFIKPQLNLSLLKCLYSSETYTQAILYRALKIILRVENLLQASEIYNYIPWLQLKNIWIFTIYIYIYEAYLTKSHLFHQCRGGSLGLIIIFISKFSTCYKLLYEREL